LRIQGPSEKIASKKIALSREYRDVRDRIAVNHEKLYVTVADRVGS